LDTVVVTAGRRAETVREVTSNITVINSATIERSTAIELGELLRQQGFQTYSAGAGGATTTVYIRGMGSSSMGVDATNYFSLLLLNGHRTGNLDVGLINLANIDRIEIIRGPAAVQYGTTALGGVINVITKRGEGPLSGSLEVGAGSVIRHKESVSLSGAYSGFDFAFGGTFASLADYRTGAGNIWRNNSVKDKYGIDADFGYSFMDTHRIGFHVNYNVVNDGRAPGGGYPTTKDYPYKFGNNDNKNYTGVLAYEGATPDKTLSWALSYVKGRDVHDSQGFADPSDPSSTYWGPAPLYPEINYITHNVLKLEQIQAQVTYDDLGLLSFTTGIDYSEQKTQMGYSLTLPTTSLKNYAFYALGKVRLAGNRLIFSLGGREDKFKMSTTDVSSKHSSTKFTPAFGVAYSPFEFLKFRANYAEGYSLPNSQQWVGDGGVYLPSPDLKPQETKTIEFGADVSWNFIDGSLTYFNTDYKNKFMSFDTGIPRPAGGTYMRFRNLEGARIAGLELDFRADLGAALNQDFSLTPYVTMTWLSKRKVKDPTVATHPDHKDLLPYTPRYMFTYGITFDYPEINLTSSLNARYFGAYVGQNFDDPILSGPPLYVFPWTMGGGFTVVDFSVSKRIWDFQDKGHLTLKVDIGNLLDYDYGYTMNYPLPGRNFYAGVVYDF
jgi:vitamin B12 transporter